MAWGIIPHLFVALFLAAMPPALLANDCSSTSVIGVRLSANSYRNMTGHWITRAAFTRRTTTDVSDLRHDERPLRYYLDVTRQTCGDDDTLTTTFSVIVPPARVGSDYKFFPNVGYYKLHTDKTNWENARRICAKEGAHLAIVNSEAEENAIREVMRAYSTENFLAFIGFHDMVKEGEYMTVIGKYIHPNCTDNAFFANCSMIVKLHYCHHKYYAHFCCKSCTLAGQLPSYGPHLERKGEPLNSSGRVRWRNGEPNDAKFPDSPEGEDCGNIYADGTINDVRCSQKLPFVCEQSI